MGTAKSHQFAKLEKNDSRGIFMVQSTRRRAKRLLTIFPCDPSRPLASKVWSPNANFESRIILKAKIMNFLRPKIMHQRAARPLGNTSFASGFCVQI